MEKLTHLSLFTGIGGLDLAAEWAGFKTVGQCEWADYPTKVLEKHWPDVPRWRDIRDLSARDFIHRTGILPGELTALSGGFPCQPFSVAGKQQGKEDDRYLWPEMLRVIRELHPNYIIGENVPGILHIAADDICKDLEREGYEVGIFDYEAAAVGAVHRRERFLFFAHSINHGCEIAGDDRKRGHLPDNSEWEVAEDKQEWDRRINRAGKIRADVAYSEGKRCGEARENCERQKEWAAGSGDVSYTKSYIAGGLPFGAKKEKPRSCSSSKNASNADVQGLTSFGIEARIRETEREARPGLERGSMLGRGWPTDWWAAEPNVGRVANGVPSRVDRLKCLGNAVVPYQAYPIFKAIADLEYELSNSGR